MFQCKLNEEWIFFTILYFSSPFATYSMFQANLEKFTIITAEFSAQLQHDEFPNKQNCKLL